MTAVLPSDSNSNPGLSRRRWFQVASCLSILFIAGCDGCRGTSDEPGERPAQNDFEPDASTIERHNRAVALMGQFDYADAHRELKLLVDQHPNWLDGKVDLAIATLNRRQTGDSEEAMALLQSVRAKAPSNLRASYCLGILSLDQGDPTTALGYFSEAADGDPTDSYAVYYAGQCEFQLGHVKEALARYETAIAQDPYLRSAYYGAFQACLRLGDTARADEFRTGFEQLDGNPQARLAEIKYTRMGPKAELKAIEAVTASSVSPPSGSLFASPTDVVDIQGREIPWRRDSDAPVTITVAGLGETSDRLILLTNASVSPDSPNVVLRWTADGFEWLPDHPLSRVSDVHSAAWGDFDNDGFVDVYLGRNGPNQLWKQFSAEQWTDVTDSTGTAGPDVETHDVQMFDADHDGDLDLLLVNDGPNELLNNNLNGTFRQLAEAQDLTGGPANSVSSLVVDIDHDRDLDFIILNAEPPHLIYLNDRLWSYRLAQWDGGLTQDASTVMVAVDTNADGRPELQSATDRGLEQWMADSDGKWQRETILDALTLGGRLDAIGTPDLDGDGQLDLIGSTARGWLVVSGDSGEVIYRDDTILAGWRLLNLPGSQGPSLLGMTQDGLKLWSPGPGRHQFIQVRFTGKEEQAEQMRSNRSGIGIDAAARVGTQWTAFRTLRSDSMPGQSLQPIDLGLAGQSRVDFVRVVWPDGVFQTEYDLAAGTLHAIAETQRQVASCPVVFAWDGEQYAFLTDVLGVGGLGFNLGRGEYGEPRPWENLLVMPQSLRPRGDRLALKIGEPMEEACYLDAARLAAYQLPSGWSMTLDERFAVLGPQPTGTPIYYRELLKPIAAKNGGGASILRDIAHADYIAAEPGERDPRFIGRTRDHVIELEFDRRLDRGRPYLLFDGWIEYPYSQTMFAAWQADAAYHAPTLSARNAAGQWEVISEQFGYMAGMPRQAVVPLDRTRLPTGTTALRISSNVEIYWDRLAVIFAEPAPAEVKRFEFPLAAARVADVGFAERTNLPQRRPWYDYGKRAPLWDTRHLRGYYSKLGPVDPLVQFVDDAVAIIGPGEEIHLEFDASSVPLEDINYYVLELNGWCKDMDLFTQHGETVEPLPRRSGIADGADAIRDQLHQMNHRRFRSGN